MLGIKVLYIVDNVIIRQIQTDILLSIKRPYIAIATQVLFKSHLYTFGGEDFRQVVGGPIGLRATCAIARLVVVMEVHLIFIRLEGRLSDHLPPKNLILN